MINRSLVIVLSVGLCALPPFAWTARARPSPTPSVQHEDASHGSTQSPGARVRSRQRARLAIMAEANGRLKERAQKLVRDVEATMSRGNTQEGCRVLRELAVALCASAREQEQLIAKLDRLIQERDAVPPLGSWRERRQNLGTDDVAQHLGAMVNGMAELIRAVEAMKPLVAP